MKSRPQRTTADLKGGLTQRQLARLPVGPVQVITEPEQHVETATYLGRWRVLTTAAGWWHPRSEVRWTLILVELRSGERVWLCTSRIVGTLGARRAA